MLYIPADGGSPVPVSRIEVPRSAQRSFLSWAVAIISRRWEFFLACPVIVVALAVLYLLTATPMFTAASTILIDTRRSPPYLASSTSEVDSSFVETQIEELRSDKTLLAVIDKLRLWEDPELGDQAEFALRRLRAIVDKLNVWSWAQDNSANQPSLNAVDTVEAKRAATLDTLRRAQKIHRAGRSYIIEVAFTLPDPIKAARLANAVAETYISDRTEYVKEASSWIEKRTVELGSRTQSAFQAVEDFKSRNNIMVDLTGKLTSERELEDLSRLRDLARAETSQMKARLDSIEAMLEKSRGATSTDLIDLIDTEIVDRSAIAQLRQQYLDAKKKVEELNVPLDRDSAAANEPLKELLALRDSIWIEVRRFAQSYAEKVQAAEGRLKAIDGRISDIFEQSKADRQSLAQLNELESKAQIYKSIYESYLTRQIQNIEQTVFPVTEARVVMAAAPPLNMSWPKPGLVLLLSFLSGTMLGLVGAIALEQLDDAIRRPEQIQDDLGLRCLGVLPAYRHRGDNRKSTRTQAQVTDSIDRTRSQDTDPLIRIKLAIDEICRKQKSVAIGIAPTNFGAGESVNLAHDLSVLGAKSGQRTLLIDGDFRGQKPMNSLAVDSDRSMEPVLDGMGPIAENVVHIDRGLDLLNSKSNYMPFHPAGPLASPAMKKLLSAARETYDYIFIDLPPILLHAEARASASHLDALVLVAQHGCTSVTELRRALDSSELLSEKVIGVVLDNSRAYPRGWPQWLSL